MTRLHKTTTNRSHHLLHADGGAHRTSPPTAQGRDIDAFYNAIDPHLDAHRRRVADCGTAFAHTPDRDINPGPECVFCKQPLK